PWRPRGGTPPPRTRSRSRGGRVRAPIRGRCRKAHRPRRRGGDRRPRNPGDPVNRPWRFASLASSRTPWPEARSERGAAGRPPSPTMLFPTTDFAIFLAVVFALSWLLNPHRTAWKWFILAASYVFYAWWDPRLVWLLALVRTIAGAWAVWVERTKDDRARRRRTLVCVAALLLPLAWFKYYGFFALNVANAFESLGLRPPLPLLPVLLPIRLSLFTFMAISYVVDVSRYEIT